MHKKTIITSLKWDLALGTTISADTWKNTFNICFKTVQDNYLIWLQYRILNRILGTKYLQHKMNIIDSSKCNICNNSIQTTKHLFVDCPPIKQLWINIQQWIKNSLNININLTPLDIILGYQHRNNLPRTSKSHHPSHQIFHFLEFPQRSNS